MTRGDWLCAFTVGLTLAYLVADYVISEFFQ